MNDPEKTRFAELLLKTPDNPFKAAMGICGEDTGRALLVSSEWPDDPFVISEQKRLLDELGADHFLPTREELGRMVYQSAQDAKFEENKVKFLKLYADIRGFIAKPETNVTVQNTNNRVMVVRENGSDDEWEQKLLKQQRGLVNASSK